MPHDRRYWDDLVDRVASRIKREDYPTGSLAELRRLKPAAPDSPAFWRLAVQYGGDDLFDDAHGLTVLASVLQGIAIVGPSGHVRGRPLGTAMFEAKIKEQRLLRLLRLDRAELPDELRRLAWLMASKDETGRFDWADAAWLVIASAGTEGGEKVRRRIAGDYFRAEYRQQNNGEKAA